MPCAYRLEVKYCGVLSVHYTIYCYITNYKFLVHYTDKLQKLQNRAPRILTFSNYEVRSSVLLDELGWERLEYVRLEQLAVTMYKIHNDLSLSYLRRIFTNTSNVHSHNPRNSQLNYYVLRPRTESAKGAYTTEDLFCGTRFPQRLETCLV